MYFDRVVLLPVLRFGLTPVRLELTINRILSWYMYTFRYKCRCYALLRQGAGSGVVLSGTFPRTILLDWFVYFDRVVLLPVLRFGLAPVLQYG